MKAGELLYGSLVCMLLLLMPMGRAMAGQELPVGGVVQVHNPSQLSEGTRTLRLKEVWRVQGEAPAQAAYTSIEDAQIGPDGNFYLLEPPVGVHVLSVAGDHLRTLSPRGQMPESQRPMLGFMLMPDGAVDFVLRGLPVLLELGSDGQVTHGSLNRIPGCALNEVRCFDGACSGEHCVLAGTVVACSPSEGQRQTWTRMLSRFSPKGYEEVRYCESARAYDSSDPRLSERDEYFPAPGRWAVGSDGRVYLAPARDEYKIHVYAPDGRLEMVVYRDFPMSPPRDPARMALFRAARASVLNELDYEYQLCDTDPVIMGMHVEDDGTIWVVHAASAYQQPEGILKTYDVFDARGQLIQQVAVACEGDGSNDALFFLGKEYVLRVAGGLSPTLTVPWGDAGPFPKEDVAREVVCYRVMD